MVMLIRWRFALAISSPLLKPAAKLGRRAFVEPVHTLISQSPYRKHVRASDLQLLKIGGPSLRSRKKAWLVRASLAHAARTSGSEEVEPISASMSCYATNSGWQQKVK